MSIKIISKRNEGFYKGITNKSLTSTSSGKFVKHYIIRNSDTSLAGLVQLNSGKLK